MSVERLQSIHSIAHALDAGAGRLYRCDEGASHREDADWTACARAPTWTREVTRAAITQIHPTTRKSGEGEAEHERIEAMVRANRSPSAMDQKMRLRTVSSSRSANERETLYDDCAGARRSHCA